MDIRELTEAMNQFVSSKGWYAENSTRPQTPRNLATSLVLESAEVLEHFQWGDEVKDKKAFESELADVALYLLQLAWVSKVDLEKVVLQKLEVNQSREWDQENNKTGGSL
jgi:NTP pyrophosphatase (non-canonical NTP hydrolase)